MPSKTEVTCDNPDCGRDITSTDFVPTFRLRLTAEPLPHTGYTVAAVIVYPPINHDLYFCGIECMRRYFLVSKEGS